MLDDFLVRAAIAGIGVALVAAPCGCFVVWRRRAYFGDTLAHAALLGVALSIALSVHLTLAVFILSAAVALVLLELERRTTVPADALLGILAHSTLALSLVFLAFLTPIRVDLMALLFGDILTVDTTDIAIIYGGGIGVLAVLAMIWRRLLAVTIDTELAAAEGINPHATERIFLLMMAAVIAITLKIVGALLITALLIIPPSAARRFATGPKQMAVIAALIGMGSVLGGLFGSLHFDIPSGPAIVIAALMFFVISLLPWRSSTQPTDRPRR